MDNDALKELAETLARRAQLPSTSADPAGQKVPADSGPPKTVKEALRRTDWALLARQKRALIETSPKSGKGEQLEGLVNWIDALQDAAHAEGFPVVWLTGTTSRRRSRTR